MSVKPIEPLCPYCQGAMEIEQMGCSACQIHLAGPFAASRLGRMPVEHQRFIELFVLCGGNLKLIAQHAGVSYPTIRSRLDKVIAALEQTIRAAPLEKDVLDRSSGVDPVEASAVIRRL